MKLAAAILIDGVIDASWLFIVAVGLTLVFGVLTTENLDQALCRSEPEGGHNVGEEAGHTAVEMARLLTSISKLRS